MTDRIDELQRLHEAATMGPWDVQGMGGVCMDGTRNGGYQVTHGSLRVARTGVGPGSGPAQQRDDMQLIAAMRNALPALLRVALAAKVLRTAMTTPPKGYGDEHQGYWWTAATEKAAEEVAEAVAALEKP